MLFGHRFFQSVEKPLSLSKNGGLALLAMLVLHRAKLLASNQSVLALGAAPSGVRAAAPHQPLSGGKGFGVRDSEISLFLKKQTFSTTETLYSVINIIIICSRPLCKAKVSTLFSQGRNLRRHIAAGRSLGRHIAVDCLKGSNICSRPL